MIDKPFFLLKASKILSYRRIPEKKKQLIFASNISRFLFKLSWPDTDALNANLPNST